MAHFNLPNMRNVIFKKEFEQVISQLEDKKNKQNRSVMNSSKVDRNERSIKKQMQEDKKKGVIKNILSKSKSVSFNNLI